MNKNLLTIKEVSERISLGRTSIYKAINDGKLVAKKFGAKTLITAESVTEFIDAFPAIGGENK